MTGKGDPTVGLSTVAEPPPWEAEGRERPTWGLAEGDEIAPGRSVLSQLGGGRRYEVFLVWDDHRLAVLVAKVLRPDQATDVSALRDLGREAEALARLSHPVIVRGFDAVTEGRLPHLLIEHLEGPTLRELIERDGTLATEQALPLGLHVASALHYVAAEGMVHLDVKPENIVMGATPRLIDFSVARPVAGAERLTFREQPDGRLQVHLDAEEVAVGLYAAAYGDPILVDAGLVAGNGKPLQFRGLCPLLLKPSERSTSATRMRARAWK